MFSAIFSWSFEGLGHCFKVNAIRCDHVALDSYALFVFESADDAETAAEFIRREYAKPSQHRLHLIPLSYEDNVPDELVWKGKQIPFYFDKRRKELLPAVILGMYENVCYVLMVLCVRFMCFPNVENLALILIHSSTF